MLLKIIDHVTINAKMSVQLCLLVLLSAQLVREGDGVITGPRSRRELGQLEPRTIEMEEGEDLPLHNEEETWRRSVETMQSFQHR